MIYTAKKNGHTRVFSDADGKLLYYRRNRWRITAALGKLEPHPAPRVIKEKPQERRERRLYRRKILGCWMVVE